MQKQLKNYNNKELADMLTIYQNLMEKTKELEVLNLDQNGDNKITTPKLSRTKSESASLNTKDIQVAIELI